MARLWDKGLPLDERILRFTAGEDHRLDSRLVEYDVRGSIAHARMLEQQGLLQATILHCLGIDHERLTFRHTGRDFRLTDVHGRIVTDLIA